MISIIVAVSRNNVIGKNNALPWKISSDLKRFKELTTGHTVIMGRKTWESIPAKFRPLSNRSNIVLTRQEKIGAPGCLVFNSLESAFCFAKGLGEIFVIGGEQIYKLSLPRVDRIYLTTVHTECEGDAHFAPLDRNQWEIESSEEVCGENDSHQYTFEILNRKANQ